MISAIVASAAVSFSLPPVPELSQERLLDAIAQAENWDGITPGKAGEWGPWQMTPAVWRQHMGALPFRTASKADLRQAAAKHLRWLCQTLNSRYLPVNPFYLAVAWNAGWRAAASKNRLPPDVADYAQRVTNLYENVEYPSPNAEMCNAPLNGKPERE
jgi:hypothetical protein